MGRVWLPGPGKPVMVEEERRAEEATMIEFVITVLLLACGIIAGLALMCPGGGRLRPR